jgi:heme-binding NEAT domain protein
MKIKILNQELELTNKVNVFIPDSKLNFQEQISIKYTIDEKLRIYDNVESINGNLN